jgi:FkbM family methyltransferase
MGGYCGNLRKVGPGVRLPKMIQHAGIVVETMVRNEPIFFFVANVSDEIQRCHFNGKFYEAQELEIISRQCEPGGVFLDVGSNVGNHAIFVEKFLDPMRVIVIEPNPAASKILRLNILLNRMSKVEMKYLGVGLSDRHQAVAFEIPPNNLGGARMRPHEGSDIQVVPGDSLFSETQVDFVKIDVEGHELEVLTGLEKTIARNRPNIFVEIENGKSELFRAWVRQHQYRIGGMFRRYKSSENYLVLPE